MLWPQLSYVEIYFQRDSLFNPTNSKLYLSSEKVTEFMLTESQTDDTQRELEFAFSYIEILFIYKIQFRS